MESKVRFSTIFWIAVIIIISLMLGITIFQYIYFENDENGQDQNISPPVAWMQIKGSIEDPYNLTFDFHNSYDPDGDDIFYYIDFGDGSSANDLRENTTTHQYQRLQGYWIKFYARDSSTRRSSEIFQFINLSNMGHLSPVAHCQYAFVEYHLSDQPVLLSAEGSYDIDGEIIGYYWDFGDGYHSSEYHTSNVRSHRYGSPGLYEVKLIVRDDAYNESITEMKVQIYADY